jgi:F1F0 ATPase subunit 2
MPELAFDPSSPFLQSACIQTFFISTGLNIIKILFPLEWAGNHLAGFALGAGERVAALIEDGLILLAAFLAGMFLGFFYFGTLWLTVRRIMDSRFPAFLSLGSFFGRLTVTLCGFYLVMGGHWERLLASLIGFFLIRRLLIRRLQPGGKTAIGRRL